MRNSCWIFVHLLNTVFGLVLWAFVVGGVWTEFLNEKPHPTYLSVEEVIFTSSAAGFFVLTRVAQRYYSMRVFLRQAVGEIEMGRSYQSQIVTLIYALVSSVAAYFCLRNHNNGATVHSRELCSALHLCIPLLLCSLYVLLVEQFSQSGLVLFCGESEEEEYAVSVPLVEVPPK